MCPATATQLLEPVGPIWGVKAASSVCGSTMASAGGGIWSSGEEDGGMSTVNAASIVCSSMRLSAGGEGVGRVGDDFCSMLMAGS